MTLRAEKPMTTRSNPSSLSSHRARRFFPTERQNELLKAIAAGPRPGLILLGYGGAMGGGKTRAIVELAIDAALAFPGNNILVARQHFTDLSSTTMKEFFDVCPDRYIRRRVSAPTNLVEVAKPGAPDDEISTINFRHLTEWTGLGSQQYGAVLIDEAGEVAEEAALMLLTRLRHPAQPQRWFVAASNPWPGWFERWFARRELDEEAFAAANGRIVYIPARIPDNPHLPDNYAAQQRALQPGEWVDRFIEGRFDAFDGQIYQHFDPLRHCWDAPLPHFTRYIGGLDFGGQSPRDHYTAGVVAGITSGLPSPPAPVGANGGLASFPSPPAAAGGDAEGRGGAPANILIRLGEFEDRGPGVTERLEQWQRDWRAKLGPIHWCADRSQSAWIDHQRRQGNRVVPSKGGPDSVSWGISLVQQRLNGDPPSSYYTPGMRQFATRIREYQWDRSAPDHAPRPLKRNDDLLDADRYMHELVVQRRSSPGMVQIELPPPGRVARWPE
ncbi:MAG: hypothetical protein F4177_05695 [Chloroflexi bacterium]|nr:hypothetical protein [Chloroflexota bacterium]